MKLLQIRKKLRYSLRKLRTTLKRTSMKVPWT